jgi:rhamnulokinase
MTDKHYIACDLGAESGRVILGTLADGKVRLDEVHRFPNGAIRIQGSLRWNLLRIFDELKTGLRKIAAKKMPVQSVSVDSWGVDYVLSNDRQPFLAPACQYRDSRTESTFPAVAERIGYDKIFAQTGIQFMSINTIYQLAAELETNPDLLSISGRFLTIADHMNYLLSGVDRNEVSLASTTQLYNPTTGNWSSELISALGLPEKLFPAIVPSATRLGPLNSDLQSETGLSCVEVIASCSHDTAAAVAAVPASGENWAFLSSGTWSLFGVELPAPLISDAARSENFSNEAGFGETTRFQKSLIGLWLLQESRRMWAVGGQQLEYAEINRLAAESEPLRSLINPNDARFMAPENMLAAIEEFCRQTDQPVPETVGQFARCIMESLSLLYAQTLDGIEAVTGKEIQQLHIVGGGSQSELLNQFAADATGRTVFSGPVEATAIGNVLIQAIAMGDIDSLADLRAVVRDSFAIDTFQPEPSSAWQHARERFAELKG